MELEFIQVSVFSIANWDIWPGIVQIVGRDDSGINLKRAFGSFVGMTGVKDVSSLVLTTTPQQEVVQYSDFTMSHMPVATWLSLLFFVEQFLFHWCHRPALSSANHGCSVGTQTEPESIPPPSPTQQRTPRTVLITENGMKSTKDFHSSTVCSTLNRSMKVTSFRQCTQCPSPSVGVFAEWAAFEVEDVKGYALLDTGASRSVGGYMMVQYVIDCLSRNTAPPWLESADPAVSFTFAGGEKAHSETRIWLPLPGTRHERFAVHIVPNEVTPILLGSGHASRIWPGDKYGFSALLQYEVAVSYSCDSAPIGTLGPCFDAVWEL